MNHQYTTITTHMKDGGIRLWTRGSSGNYTVTPEPRNYSFVMPTLPSGSVYVKTALVVSSPRGQAIDHTLSFYRNTGGTQYAYDVNRYKMRDGAVITFDISSVAAAGDTFNGTIHSTYVNPYGIQKDALYKVDADIEFTYEAAETPCLAPVTVKLSRASCKEGATANLRWSGADEGRGHPIIGYAVQYSDDGGTTWASAGTATTDDTSGVMAVHPPESTNITRMFRVKTICGHDAFSSGWTVCPTTLSVVLSAAGSDTPKLPWLYDRDLNKVCRLYPLNCSLNLTTSPPSSAQMTLADDVAIQTRQFVELFTMSGSAGIYQVTAISRDYANKTQSITLQHAIATLTDALVLTGETISGSVHDVLEYLLTFQTAVKSDGDAYWEMGESEVPDDLTVTLTYSAGNLLTAVNSLMSLIDTDYMLDFEQLATGWKINVISYPADHAVLRMNRNIISMTMSVNTTNLCTRLYPYGSGEGEDRVDITSANEGVAYIDADTISTYGIISRTLTEETIEDPAELLTVAQAYMRTHKEPTVSMTISAVDLSNATGEAVDEFGLGWSCRVALPQSGESYTEHIIGVAWSDLYGQPNVVSLTLANREQDIADSISGILKAASIRNFHSTKTNTVTHEYGATIAASATFTYTLSIDCERVISAYLTDMSTVDSVTVGCTETGKSITATGSAAVDVRDLITNGATDNGAGVHTITFTSSTATGQWVCNGRFRIKYIERS